MADSLLTFKVLDLLIDDRFMTKEDIKTLPLLSWIRDTGENLYSFSEWIEQDRFLLIYCEYDNKRYRETVYDTEQEIESENPRKPYQNELRQQFFACYDAKEETLYLSDFQKKSVLQSYIKEQTDKEIRIRERFNSIDGFCEMAKFIRSISFIQRHSLMNSAGNTVFQQMYGALGLDIPERAITKVDYGVSPIGLFRKAIHEIKKRKDNCEFDSVVIVGMDADGAEVRFSYETLVSNKPISVEKNENGRYDSTEVFNALIAEIGAQDA